MATRSVNHAIQFTVVKPEVMHMSNTGEIVRVVNTGEATFGFFVMRPDPKSIVPIAPNGGVLWAPPLCI